MPSRPEPLAEGMILEAEQWDRLRRNDHEEWLRLLAGVMPVARTLIKERFGLVHLHGGDQLAAAGAMWSAWSSFQRHFLEDGFTGVWTIEDLAVQLIRITHNRLGRERRRQDRLRLASDKGALAGPSGPLIDTVKDPARGPEEGVSLAELLEKMRDAIDELMEQLETPKKREAIGLWLSFVTKDERGSQTKIAKQLGVNQSTVSRWLEEFKADVRRMLGSGEQGA
jgi:DNA-directed RNA polymerase specialized sigma24 family protein